MPKFDEFKFQKTKIKRFTSFVNIYSACLIDTGIVISKFLLLFCLNF